MHEAQHEEIQSIVDLIQDWLAATKRNDLAHVLSLAHDDLLFHVPGVSPFGKAAFAQFGGLPEGTVMEGSATTDEVEVCGDLGYARTYLDLTFTAADGTVAHHAGWSLTIYRRNAAGRWQLWRDANFVKQLPA